MAPTARTRRIRRGRTPDRHVSARHGPTWRASSGTYTTLCGALVSWQGGTEAESELGRDGEPCQPFAPEREHGHEPMLRALPYRFVVAWHGDMGKDGVSARKATSAGQEEEQWRCFTWPHCEVRALAEPWGRGETLAGKTAWISGGPSFWAFIGVCPRRQSIV